MKLTSNSRCTYCQQPLGVHSQFCSSCGKPIQRVQPAAALSASPTSSIDTVARVQPFHRWLLDWADPVQAIGLRLERFSLSQGYIVGQSRSVAICRDIYELVFQKLRAGSLDDVQVDVIDYHDIRYKQLAKEKARRYIRLIRETNRRTRTSVLARFRADGDHIYIAVDAYILGGLDWRQFLRQLVIVPVLVLLVLILLYRLVATGFSNQFGELDPTLILLRNICIIGYTLFLGYYAVIRRKPLTKIIRSYRREHNLMLALRQCYPRISRKHSFNEDDVLMFLKSTLNMIADAVSDVFQQYNMPTSQFMRYIMTINNYNSIIGDGTINQVGNQIGGVNNTM